VASQLREELATIVIQEMKDPRVSLASITEVIVSPDLKEARVKVSALGTDEQREDVVKALQRAEGFLRGLLGSRLQNLKYPPHLHFMLDESIAYAVKISKILSDLETEKKDAK
jgi:ribosome-binding factor A